MKKSIDKEKNLEQDVGGRQAQLYVGEHEEGQNSNGKTQLHFWKNMERRVVEQDQRVQNLEQQEAKRQENEKILPETTKQEEALEKYEEDRATLLENPESPETKVVTCSGLA